MQLYALAWSIWHQRVTCTWCLHQRRLPWAMPRSRGRAFRDFDHHYCLAATGEDLAANSPVKNVTLFHWTFKTFWRLLKILENKEWKPTLLLRIGFVGSAGGSTAITGAPLSSAHFLAAAIHGCRRSCSHISWSSKAQIAKSTEHEGKSKFQRKI